MTNKKIYNFFLFMSTLTRSLVEVFSVIFLYDMGYSVNNIMLYLLVLYSFGVLVNVFSLVLKYRFVLLLSVFLYGFSYLFLSMMDNTLLNLIIFAICFSSSSYSYHVIRHYLAMKLVDYDKGSNINIILIVTYVAVILSNILGMMLISKLSMFWVSVVIIGFSLVSIFPILKLDNIQYKKINIKSVKIDKNSFIFNVLEQFKVIFLEIQPLYLYIFVKSSKYYVGIFNIIINVASLVIVIFMLNKISKSSFKYFNILLAVVLILKLNIDNSIFLFFIAFFEGIGVKIFERFSLDNLYNYMDDDVRSYLCLKELTFFVSKSLFMVVFYLLGLSLKVILYICIVGIVISGFYIGDKD